MFALDWDTLPALERRRDAEMRAALKADGEKLRYLTSEDHGPHYLVTCNNCGGSGGFVEYDEPGPYAGEIWIECQSCSGAGFWLGEPPPLDDIDLDDRCGP